MEKNTERNQALHKWCMRLKNLSFFGILFGSLITLLIMKAMQAVHIEILFAVTLPFTVMSIIAVILNFMLPKDMRIRTTSWLGRNPNLWGPIHNLVIIAIINYLFFGPK